MAKKTSPTKALEEAQKRAERELKETRRRIRSQGEFSTYEYGILHEDTVAEAKKAATVIDQFFARLATHAVPTLVLYSAGDEKLVLAIIEKDGIGLFPNKPWKMSSSKSMYWDDSDLPMLQTMSVKGPDTVACDVPLHRFLESKQCLLLIGEDAVAKHILPVKKKSDGERRRDRFNFFYKLTRDLGYELLGKELKERVEQERGRVGLDQTLHRADVVRTRL